MVFIAYIFVNNCVWSEDLAEEVGVEPTRRLLSVSTALKAARPTGGDTLPKKIRR